MAEIRQPIYRIAIKGPEGRRVAELYPAALFPGGEALYEAVVAMTDPWQGPDGRWRVFLVGRREPVLIEVLTRN